MCRYHLGVFLECRSNAVYDMGLSLYISNEYLSDIVASAPGARDILNTKSFGDVCF